MKLECTYKRITPKEEIYLYCRQRLNKIETFFNNSLHCRVTLIAQRYDVRVEIRVDGNHTHYNAMAEHDSIYGAIDQAVEKMHKQLNRKKAKMSDRRNKRKKKDNLVYLDEIREAQFSLRKVN